MVALRRPQPSSRARRLSQGLLLAAGDQLGLLPRWGNPPNLGYRRARSIHARESGCSDRGRLSGHRVPIVQRTSVGLQDRGHRHDGVYDHDGFPRAVGSAGIGALQLPPYRHSARLRGLTFLVANPMLKIDGGWMPLTVGAVVMMVMLTWRRGTRILADKGAQGRGAPR